MNRKEKFFIGDEPKYIRCYDNGGETLDRYTVVFTGNYRKKTGGSFWHLGFSANPYFGIGMSGESTHQIDKPTYSHLGKKIKFAKLHDEGKKFVIQKYCYLWDLE